MKYLSVVSKAGHCLFPWAISLLLHFLPFHPSRKGHALYAVLLLSFLGLES